MDDNLLIQRVLDQIVVAARSINASQMDRLRAEVVCCRIDNLLEQLYSLTEKRQ